MRYVGGKSKIAKQIVARMRELSPGSRVAVEPFMGGGGVTEHLVRSFDRVRASDAHVDLVMMWQAVQGGWLPPEEVPEELYAQLKDSEPSALRGLVGFGGSFGGKFFGGYARGGVGADGMPRNHQGESARAVARIGSAFQKANIQIEQSGYLSVLVSPGDVVYCDPPYASTLGYTTGGFDSDEFWRWAAAKSEHADVYVSEYEAPEGWESVWSAQKRQSVTLPAQGRELRTEHLFKKVSESA